MPAYNGNAIAVATIWLVGVGGLTDTSLSASSLSVETDDDGLDAVPLQFSTHSQQPLSLSCFRRGFLRILASVIQQMPLPMGCFSPSFSLSSA
ncbi:MAG: hypothetical protein F6J98_43670 [Moorea sp. SIO4G2]|nr:hypothetical protein [Moorena sp. SIO4G2]